MHSTIASELAATAWLVKHQDQTPAAFVDAYMGVMGRAGMTPEAATAAAVRARIAYDGIDGYTAARLDLYLGPA